MHYLFSKKDIMPPKTSKQKAALQRWIRRRGVPIPVALPVAAGLPLAPLVATNVEEVMNGSGLHRLRNGGRRIARVPLPLSEKERAKLFKSKREYMQKKRNDLRDNNAAIALRKKKKRHENSQKILGGRLIERGASLKRLRLPSERKFLSDGDLQNRVDLKIDREKIVAKETSDRVQKRIRELTTKMERSHSKLKEQVELIERLKKRSAKIMNNFNINGGGGGVSSGSVDVKGDEDDDVRSVDSDATGVVNLQEEEDEGELPKKKKKKMAVKTAVKKTRTST